MSLQDTVPINLNAIMLEDSGQNLAPNGATADSTTGNGVIAFQPMVFDGTNVRRLYGYGVPADALGPQTYSNLGTLSFGEIFNGTNFDRARSVGGVGDAASTGIPAAGPLDFNATTWDRHRNNTEVSVFASSARTVTANSADQTNYNARGARFFLDISAVSGTTPTLDVKLQSKDSISANYVDIPSAAFAQKTATGTDDLVVYPGAVASANRSLSQIISRTWRAVATIGGTTPSFTFSLSVAYVL